MNEQILELTKKLIEIPSTADNPKALEEVLEVAKEKLKDFTMESFDDNGISSLLFYAHEKRPESFKVLLNGHLDVVPAPKSQFSPLQKDGKLYGRGTNDMKAGAAALTVLFKQLAKTVPYPLGLQLVTDEETGGFHGAKYQLAKGVKADFILAGEPTDLGINTQAKGIMWVDIKTSGKTAHGAYPWNGENAIWKMHGFLEKLHKAFPTPEQESWETTINLASIESTNKTYNKVADDALVRLDIRYIPKDKDTIEKKLKELLPHGFTMHIHAKEPAHYSKEDSKYLEKLQKVVEKHTGKKAELVVKHGGSDVRFYTEAGSEGVTFGPVGAGLHSDEEWVDIQGLGQYYEIMKDFLTELK